MIRRAHHKGIGLLEDELLIEHSQVEPVLAPARFLIDPRQEALDSRDRLR